MAETKTFRGSTGSSSPRPFPHGAPQGSGAPSGAVLETTPGPGPHPPLDLPAGLRGFIEELARKGYPNEACGLLLGRQEPHATRVARVTLARNLAEERRADRYILDPQDYLLADKSARRDRLEIVGIWHTHPDHPARPSITDLNSAWPDYTYIIVAVHQREVADLTAWRLDGSHFVQQTIEEGS